MDRHNMALFLQSDTSKLHPAGFEISRRNIFDPSEDPVCVPVFEDSTKPLEGLDDRRLDNNHVSEVEAAPNLTNPKKRNGANPPRSEKKTDKKCGDDADEGVPSKATKRHTCSREGCTQRPRFDSIFCSDSCGVSALETDLLCSLQYADKLHPSILRS